MIRLGLRLTFNGGKEAAIRLLITSLAVGIGVGMLLITLSGMNGINSQNKRAAWLATGLFGDVPVNGPALSQPPLPPGMAVSSTPKGSPVWWAFREDHFHHRTIYRVDVAVTGSKSPIPPGLTRLPSAGEFYASPALAALLKSTPAAELADRYPGRQVGVIGAAGLPSPNSLIVVVGRPVSAMSGLNGLGPAQLVTSINTSSRLGGPAGFKSTSMEIILAVGALALLFPVLVFIGTATRLAAARREQRFAAMRLVGATPRQVSVITAVEAAVAAGAGLVVGCLIYLAVRGPLTGVSFTGAPFAKGDLSLGWGQAAAVIFGVPIGSVVASRLAMRKVIVSPLGVSRRVTPSRPRPYGLLPTAAGLGLLLYWVVAGRPSTTGGQIWGYLGASALVLVGLVLVGPWLTMVGSRWMLRSTPRVSVLIAGRRLSDNPRGAFRSISGLIVALFVTSLAVGIITSIVASSGSPTDAPAPNRVLVQDFNNGDPFAAAGPHVGTAHVGAALTSLPASLIAALRAIPGVQGLAVIHEVQLATPDQQGRTFAFVGLCSQLKAISGIGRCRAGTEVAVVTGSLDSASVSNRSTLTSSYWPDAHMTPAALGAVPVRAVVVGTSSAAALERVRTSLELTVPSQGPPSTVGEISDQTNRITRELQQMADVVILVSLVIAGCSLAVSVTGGVNDRKRPFSLLRLAGTPMSVLRNVVLLEAALPLISIAVISAGMGMLTAGLFLDSQLSYPLHAPGGGYYGVVGSGLLGALLVIAATLPLIQRITGPETARNE